GGMLSASKLLYSVSTSGPSSIEKPRPWKKSTTSRSTRVIGCRPPRGRRRPGSVTSSRRPSCRSWAARSSAWRRARKSASMRSFAALARSPAGPRSAGGSAPMPCSSAASALFLPRKRERTWASAGRPSASAIARSASAASASRLRSSSPMRRPLRLGELGLGAGDQLGERLRIGGGEIRQVLAVDLDARLVEAVHQLAVGERVLAGSGVDARDPQAAELALALLAVAVRVDPGALDGLAGHPEQPAARSVVALGLLQDAVVPAPLDDASLHSGHARLLSRRARYGSSCSIRLRSTLATSTRLRRRRFRLVSFLVRMWCLPSRMRVILPVPVRLKRLAAPRWVFIFGISGVSRGARFARRLALGLAGRR